MLLRGACHFSPIAPQHGGPRCVLRHLSTLLFCPHENIPTNEHLLHLIYLARSRPRALSTRLSAKSATAKSRATILSSLEPRLQRNTYPIYDDRFKRLVSRDEGRGSHILGRGMTMDLEQDSLVQALP